MKLTILERVLIPGILIAKGTLHEICLSRDITEKIDFTADEIKKARLDVKNNVYSWKENIETKIELSIDEQNHLKESAKKVDKEAKVTDKNIKLIERFINEDFK